MIWAWHWQLRLDPHSHDKRPLYLISRLFTGGLITTSRVMLLTSFICVGADFSFFKWIQSPSTKAVPLKILEAAARVKWKDAVMSTSPSSEGSHMTNDLHHWGILPSGTSQLLVPSTRLELIISHETMALAPCIATCIAVFSCALCNEWNILPFAQIKPFRCDGNRSSGL